MIGLSAASCCGSVVEEGSNGRADCPADNVNRFERMFWTLPTCRRSLRLQTTIVDSLMFIRLLLCDSILDLLRLESVDLQVCLEQNHLHSLERYAISAI